ncbi:hypothetical protein tb265_29360 [Gemmatimonadetes bacterium T265]|nr:hypothetical protein tb265_29360 [Gemmatimonadetes bacterium T265]
MTVAVTTAVPAPTKRAIPLALTRTTVVSDVAYAIVPIVAGRPEASAATAARATVSPTIAESTLAAKVTRVGTIGAGPPSPRQAAAVAAVRTERSNERAGRPESDRMKPGEVRAESGTGGDGWTKVRARY